MATATKALVGLDRFPRAASQAVPRIIGVSAGEFGSGKTHFWCTAPGPIVFLSFDKGLEGVVEPFTAAKDIRVVEYDWAPTDKTFTRDQAVALRDQFADDFEFACHHARTVVIDRENDFWELSRYAEFGGPSANPNDYAQLNQRYKKILSIPKSLTINAGYVTGLKDEWVSVQKANGKKGGESSGNRILAGFKDIGGLVNVELFHERRKGEGFYATVGKARGPGAAAVQDQEFQSLDFATLGMLLFPDADEEAWA